MESTDKFGRFVVEAQHAGTTILDRVGDGVNGPDFVTIAEPLLSAAVRVVRFIDRRGPDEFVEVYSTGVGLAMAGILQAYGLNVISAHVWGD